jgi:hypothetical protein
LFHVVSFLQVFETKPCRREISPNRATCFAHLILCGMVAGRIHVEEYTSRSSSLLISPQSPVSSYLLYPNIFRSTLFCNTLTQYLSRGLYYDRSIEPSKTRSPQSAI